MQTSAQRIVVTAPKQVSIQPFSLPAPGPTELLLKATTTLISPGTERAFYLDLENTFLDYPLYPGYSFIGEVLAAGAEVSAWQVGQRVACTANHASHALVQAGACLPVPGNLPDEDAVFFNLIAIAMQGVRKARLELGESVAVLGAGPIGLFAMRLAQLSGGLPVIGVDLDAKRLEVARQVGADETLLNDDTLLDAIKRLTPGGDGADVVVEVTGAPQAVLTAFRAAATKGRVVLLGGARGDTEKINFYLEVHRKGLHVIGAHEITRPLFENSPGYWTQHSEHRVALDLLARDKIQAQPLITHRFGWQQFTQAYALLADWNTDAMGMVIDWS